MNVRPIRIAKINTVAVIAATLVLSMCGCQKRQSAVPPEPDLSSAYKEVAAHLDVQRKKVVASPTDTELWKKYGMALDAHQYDSEAIKCYRQAVELAPENFESNYLLAIKLKPNAPQQSEMFLAKAIEAPRASLASLLCYFDLLSQLGNLQQADRILNRAIEEFADQPAVLLRQANRAFDAGDLSLAREKLSSIEHDFRETARLQMRLAAADSATDVAEGDPDKLPPVDDTVEDSVRSAVLAHRRDPLWRGLQAAQQAWNGDQLGMMVLADLVRRYPELVDNRLQLASLIAQQGSPEQAEEILTEGLTLSPNNTRLMSGSVAIAILNEDWDLAERRLNELLEVAPDSSAGWSDLGFVLEQQGKRQRAFDAYGKSLKLAPDDSEIADRQAALLEIIKKSQRP